MEVPEEVEVEVATKGGIDGSGRFLAFFFGLLDFGIFTHELHLVHYFRNLKVLRISVASCDLEGNSDFEFLVFMRWTAGV